MNKIRQDDSVFADFGVHKLYVYITHGMYRTTTVHTYICTLLHHRRGRWFVVCNRMFCINVIFLFILIYACMYCSIHETVHWNIQYM